MSKLVAGALVFFTSAAVLVLEIMAGRLLAPYVGVSLETFTGIIGVVLAGIALGTWLGGAAADRFDPHAMVGPLVVTGGVLALVAPPLVDLFGSGLQGGGPPVIVFLAFVGFFAPAAVLSAVSPTVVKLQLADLHETGTVVGRLSALGTAGAIFGTFATGFVLVAAIPSRPIVLGLGAALVLVGIALTVRLQRRSSRLAIGPVALMAAVAIIAPASISLVTPRPCDEETTYYCVRVRHDPERASGRLLILDTLWHSYVDLDDPTHLQFTYAQTASDVIAGSFPDGEPLRTLHIGGGGFTMPRYLAATRPGSTNVVLELDAGLVNIARRDLGLRDTPGLDIRTGDARMTLRGTDRGAFDLVIGDAFGGPSVPWHLTTREFVEEIQARLRPGGVYVLNLIDYPPLGFARAEAVTLLAVFEHVTLLAPPPRLLNFAGGNFILVGSDAPIAVDAILEHNAGRGDDESAFSDAALRAFVEGSRVLRDDFAPVDQLLTH
ncbi:MAG: fused MFS/spermidine synthase [Chloroflexi bacterium]|nr:fused MFS/spermidine synthase [Chloroflexota bacterium]MDA1001970.1 fused MFS/spermidine synthase [Chloroflexota bacterium]